MCTCTVYVRVHVYVRARVLVQHKKRIQVSAETRRIESLSDQEAVSYLMWMLGLEHGSSTRAVNALY